MLDGQHTAVGSEYFEKDEIIYTDKKYAEIDKKGTNLNKTNNLFTNMVGSPLISKVKHDATRQFKQVFWSLYSMLQSCNVVKWENGKVAKSEMSWKALFGGFFARDIA